MFGFGNKAKRDEKKALKLLNISYEFSSLCLNALCETLNTESSDPAIRKILKSDDSLQFWYIYSLGIMLRNDFEIDHALVLCKRIFGEFLPIGGDVDKFVERARQLEESGLKKVQNKTIDRNSKVQLASVAAAISIADNRKISHVALTTFVMYICRTNYGVTSFEEYDRIIVEENFDT